MVAILRLKKLVVVLFDGDFCYLITHIGIKFKKEILVDLRNGESQSCDLSVGFIRVPSYTIVEREIK